MAHGEGAERIQKHQESKWNTLILITRCWLTWECPRSVFHPSQVGVNTRFSSNTGKKISHEETLTNPKVIKTRRGCQVRPWGTQQICSVCWQSRQEGSSGMTWRNNETPGVTLIGRKHPYKNSKRVFWGEGGKI